MKGFSEFGQGDAGAGGVRPLRRRSVRVLVVSMLVSAAIHVVAILLYPALMRRAEPEASATPETSPATRFRAARAVRLVEVSEVTDEPAPPREPREPEPEPREPAREEISTFPEEGKAAPDDVPTAAELLRPKEGDPRIWRPVSPEGAELTDEERARIRLYTKLEAWNDSVATDAELGPLRDWTFTDEEGKRWGISPGALHLGGLTLPLPFSFGAGGAGNLQETMQRQWEWQDIERGAAATRARATRKERAEAIRERKDREREEKADTTGGGGGSLP